MCLMRQCYTVLFDFFFKNLANYLLYKVLASLNTTPRCSSAMSNGFRDLRILKQVFGFQPISNVALVCDNNSLTHMTAIKTLVSQHDVRFLH